MEFIYSIKAFIVPLILVVVFSYLMGSISFSIIFTKIFKKKDIRGMGSGNAGFTNVLRSAGYLPSALTFIFDFLKGILAVYISINIFKFLTADILTPFLLIQYVAYLSGIACIIGHIYPCFFKFKGGKGVLTSAAVVLIIDPIVFLVCILVFIIVLLFSKIISLSSICAAALLPFAAFLVRFFIDCMLNSIQVDAVYNMEHVLLSVLFSFIIGGLVIIKHKSNIKRLKDGTEKKFAPKKSN